jgi:hypothetical protein
MAAPEDGVGRLLHASKELRHHLRHAVQLLLPLHRRRPHARIKLGLRSGTAPSLASPAGATLVACSVLQFVPVRSCPCGGSGHMNSSSTGRAKMASVHLRLADDLEGAGGAGGVDGDAHTGAVLQPAAQHRDVHVHGGGPRLRRPPPQPRQRVADRPPTTEAPKTVLHFEDFTCSSMEGVHLPSCCRCFARCLLLSDCTSGSACRTGRWWSTPHRRWHQTACVWPLVPPLGRRGRCSWARAVMVLAACLQPAADNGLDQAHEQDEQTLRQAIRCSWHLHSYDR